MMFCDTVLGVSNNMWRNMQLEVGALNVLFQLKDMFEEVEQLQAEIAASLPQHHL